jgi:hypothetical protein
LITLPSPKTADWTMIPKPKRLGISAVSTGLDAVAGDGAERELEILQKHYDSPGRELRRA